LAGHTSHWTSAVLGHARHFRFGQVVEKGTLASGFRWMRFGGWVVFEADLRVVGVGQVLARRGICVMWHLEGLQSKATMIWSISNLFQNNKVYLRWPAKAVFLELGHCGEKY
jgi:hypothetical protein